MGAPHSLGVGGGKVPQFPSIVKKYEATEEEPVAKSSDINHVNESVT